MILQDWWYTTLLSHQYTNCPPLTRDLRCDVLIVGGGMSGIMAAAEFIGQGLSVVVLEKNILGGSSTGRSAGFLTPDSELELSQLMRRYGVHGAKELWEVPCRGIDLIRENVRRHGLDCDLIRQDSLFLGIGAAGRADVAGEIKSRETLGFASTRYDEAALRQILGAEGYTAAVRYSDTYGINALQYAQGLKEVLLQNGIRVFESTEVREISGHTARTHAGSVTAGSIIVAIDKMPPAFNPLADEVFHAQTFLSISEPLSDADVRAIFPGDHFQCWDSTLVYTYFRLTGDQRLLVGGGSALTTFMKHADNSSRVIDRVIAGFHAHFPALRRLRFIQYWPGLIDTTRDLLPVVVRPPGHDHLHFILGVVGLPWASFSGSFAARNVLGTASKDDHRYYRYFTDRRHFFLPCGLEAVIGKPLLFSLNNAWAKYYQVDRKNRLPEKAADF
ncbi:MAG: FAD-binding oxidoreductase [Opitutaceae bacterium]